MPLNDYTPPAPMRWRDTHTTRVVQEEIDSDGGIKASGPAEVYAGRDFERLEQYGIASEPPNGTGYARTPGDPLPVGHERAERPSGVPSLGSGESALYGPSGDSHVHCHDNVDVIPKPGDKVRLGGTTGIEAVAYGDVLEANASEVAVSASEAVRQANLAVDLGRVKADLLALWNAVLNIQVALMGGVAGGTEAPLADGSAPTFTATTWTASTAGTKDGYVKTGSSTTEVKP